MPVTENWNLIREVYDIDMVSVYKELRKKLDTPDIVLRSGIDGVRHLSVLKDEIKNYCEANNLDFEEVFDKGYLLADSSNALYIRGLAWRLVYLEKVLIRLFLNYHKRKSGSPSKFVTLLEFRVLPILLNNLSPFADFEERQEIVAKWIEANKRYPRIKKINKNPKTFEDLFMDPSNAIKVIDVLTKNKILHSDGSWIGFSKFQSEVTALIDVLEEKNYIRVYQRRVTGRVFKEQFKMNLTDRALNLYTKVSNKMHPRYNKIIPDLQSL